MPDSSTEPGRGLSIVDRLSRRSTWIFLLLALLAGLANYLVASQTADERASAAEINLAGRRRMLSQQVGLLASQLQRQTPPRPETLADLGLAVHEMADIHRTLIDGTPDRRIRPLPEALAGSFYAPGGAHAQITRFLDLGLSLQSEVADTRVFQEALEQLVALSRGEVLFAVDHLVGDYQRLSEGKSDALRHQLWLVLIAGLGLLAYSALGILRPLIAEVRRTLANLEASETTLRQTMAENRLILDTTDEGLFGVDRQGRIRFINPAAAQMLGVGAEELVGQAHHPAILSSTADCPICTALTCAQRQKIDGAHFNRKSDGKDERFAVEYSVVPRPDGQGAVISFRDISERLIAEERVQRIRQRLVDAIEAMDDAFALFDADDRLSLYNLRFTEFFPLPGEYGPLGMSFSEFIHEVGQRGLYAQLPENLDGWWEERLKAHRQADGSMEIPCADGRWLRVTERRTREGGTVVIWSDVTHLKHALIAADRGSRAKSEFLSRMSHELRTPLNAILGFAQVLELAGGQALSAEQHEYIGHILHGGRHLLSLINEVLDLSAIEAGKMVIDIEEVALAPLTGECLTLVSPLATNRRIRMQIDIPAECAALADRKRLKQVLINLLSNAIKYNRDDGEVRITCGNDGERLRLGIHDTGSGIAPEQAERVFQPFERLGREEVEGTGIGLAITRRLVELMGGGITFDSRPGQGTNFWIDLPSACPNSVQAGMLEAANLPIATVDRGKTVISLGVDTQTRQILELICRTLDHTRLLICASPDEALAAARASSCLAIVAPPSLLAELGEEQTGHSSPPARIALTTEAADDTAGIDYWHPLPPNPRHLARILRELAHGYRTSQPT